MPIMCYEQFFKKLFNIKGFQSANDSKKTVKSDKLPRKLDNRDDKRVVYSEDSWSSSNTCIDYVDTNSSSILSSRSPHSSLCKNCLQSENLNSFRRHYSELLKSPQQIVPVTNINLPPSIHRPCQKGMSIDHSKIYSYNRRRRTWTHRKTNLSATNDDDIYKHSYHFSKTFHSPPPNKNPFDIDP